MMTDRKRACAAKEVRGAAAVADARGARAARPALVNRAPALVWMQQRTPQVVFRSAITRGKIVEISRVADPERLRELDVEVVD